MLTLGGRFAGFSFFIQKKRLNFAYNFLGLERYGVTATEGVPAGSATLRMEFTASGAKGVAALFINGKKVGEGEIPRTVPVTFGLSEGLTVGCDPSTPVIESYQSRFEFNGKIKKVVMELKEDAKPNSGQ